MTVPLLPILLLASAEPAPPPPYPVSAVLDLFAKTCRGVSDYAATAKAARDAGWEEVPASAEPHLAKLVEIGMTAVPEGRKSGLTFRRTVSGHALYLVLSRYEDARIWGNGCRMYDFAASAELPETALENWMQRPSTFRQAQPGVLVKLTWQPGWSRDITVEAAYIPKGSGITQRTGLVGTALVAQATGAAQQPAAK
ncbi:MAG TPA: hypothetical protein VNZ43_14330 [Sphingomonadaceae bacterium]|nr:hypothetical protein [Sphingomonadaceae bacterium]